jgi:hypothetical protein
VELRSRPPERPGDPDSSASFGGPAANASGAEPGPALGPSPGKDLSPRPGPHPEAEPVGLLPSSSVWLKGAFHGFSEEQQIIGGRRGPRQRSSPREPDRLPRGAWSVAPRARSIHRSGALSATEQLPPVQPGPSKVAGHAHRIVSPGNGV